MLPTKEQAEIILAESAKINPGPWEAHCRVAATCAEKIASKCKDLNESKAYILGLLHDIGRRFGMSHFGHIVNGYRYMSDLGYDEVARICLTHSFVIKDIGTYIGNIDVPDSDVQEMKLLLKKTTYDDYDRLIQLCDCLAMPEGTVKIETRMDDIEKRYKYYPQSKKVKNFELKKYFDEKAGLELYDFIL